MNYPQILYKIDCRKITLNFSIPLKSLGDDIFTLELFHGPTLAFKDIGARFMAQLLCSLHSTRLINLYRILVATSSDTGTAVASAFLGIDGIEVILLIIRVKR